MQEAFVAWLWERRRIRRPLLTLDGRVVQVAYPGWRWGSWGPDFHAALLSIDGELRRGDVEIHVHAADWRRHGHAHDPAYDATVLHVVFDAPLGETSLSAAGELIPIVALCDQLDGSLAALQAEWVSWVPRRDPPGCLEPDVAGIVLDQAGVSRLRNRAARYEGDMRVVSPEQALWTGALEALGYARNTGPFHRLAERVPLVEAQAFAQDGSLAAVLFGEAGLLPRQLGCEASDAEALALEAHLGLGGQAPIPPNLGWTRVGCRPANSPARRVAAAASLLTEPPGWPAVRTLCHLVLSDEPPRQRARQLRVWFIREGTAYWRSHHGFGLPLHRASAVVGPDRAALIVVNVVLPWVLALARSWGNDPLARAAEHVYRSHPVLSWNAISRHMATQIVGPAAGAVVRTECRQQGLLQIYRGWCAGRDCLSCPARPTANEPPPPESAGGGPGLVRESLRQFSAAG